MLSKYFLSNKIESLLGRSVKANGPLRPPVDPGSLAQHCGVVSIEHRPMVPEGVLAPVAGGFVIFLQSNFAGQPAIERRQRFTIAHELVHTFYYDLNCGEIPKRKKESPKGQKLEQLCHIGASQILMPEVLLRRELEATDGVASAESILRLSRVFDVSAEALIRRLQGLGAVANDKFAAILVGTEGGKHIIEAACYGPLLLWHAAPPKRGLEYSSWVRPLLGSECSSPESEWTRATSLGTVTAKKVFRSKRSFILTLRFD